MTTDAAEAAMQASGVASELADLRASVDVELARAFSADDWSVAPLGAAIDYSLLAPGKRIRPVLALAAAEACGARPGPLAAIAAAFELIHAYSLVHDDLPAMDDDDLRRGVPTSHKVYGDAVAVLVGDALQARAFELVAGSGEVSATARIAIVTVLARAAGWRGMVGGQYLDVEDRRVEHPAGGPDAIAALRDVHDRKTGALIAGAVEAGAIAAGADDATRDRFATFGRELGWLFQLVDDLLDATGSAESLGKTPGKDARSGKVTAIDVYGGNDELRSAADEQLELCLELAAALPDGGGRLPRIASFVHGRDH